MSLKLVVVRNMQLLVLSAVCSFVDLIIIIIKLAVERLKIILELLSYCVLLMLICISVVVRLHDHIMTCLLQSLTILSHLSHPSPPPPLLQVPTKLIIIIYSHTKYLAIKIC